MTPTTKIQLRRIGPEDTEWHEAFHRYIQRVFPRVSFRQWCEYGGWTQDYAAYALVLGREIIANASVQRMNVIVGSRSGTGWQFGAVGTVPEWRGRGLQRQVMSEALKAVPPSDLAFLFANPNVIDFYPRFGFKHVQTSIYGIDHKATPAPQKWECLQVDRPDHRALLERISTLSRPVTSVFGARAYSSVALWYWTQFNREHFYYSEPLRAIVVAEQKSEVLYLLDVMAPEPIDIKACLPHVIRAPVSRVEFGFTPEILWPEAIPAAGESNDEGSPLFIRDSNTLPQRPFNFPALAHT